METVRVNTPNPSETRSKETALRDFVRFSWKATRGLVNQTENDIKKLVSALGNTGKITTDQEQKLIEQLSVRMKESRKQFENEIEGHIDTTVLKISKLYQEEISSIEASIAKLEQQFQNLK
ncbi:MAG: hypothetical protein KDD52_01185 [Bdellovibrionales bacterium]|nr:hypothetical protein [Bdellovibrionales bacterium]